MLQWSGVTLLTRISDQAHLTEKVGGAECVTPPPKIVCFEQIFEDMVEKGAFVSMLQIL